MLKQAYEILNHRFGYSDFRGQQKEVVESVLKGESALVLMPTGGGKSLCYQVPAMVLEGLAIVVSPLIALMQDQVSALQQLGVRAAYLNSTLSAQQKNQIMREVYEENLDILYIAPERLLKEATLQRLMTVKIALIAIDEAHCVSQWGHDFREDYLGLHVLQQAFENVPTIALTATADERTRAEIIHRLGLTNCQTFVSSFDRPNIRYKVQIKNNPKTQLLNFLKQRKGKAGIVYCMSRNRVETVATWLQQAGYKAAPYHAGMDKEKRWKNQQDFLRDDIDIMVATVAFGMGIDKPDVRFVAHLDLPKNLESYYQETGRAGRDGEASEAWMIYGIQDVVRNMNMVQDSTAAQQHKMIEQSKLNYLLAWCELTTCRRRNLLQYFAEKNTQACGNCDNCLAPPKTWEATVDAQKLLSNIYRLGQVFGAAHVIDVLRGKLTEKVKQYSHQQLSTYGIGEQRSDQQWRSIVRQLIVQGYIFANEQKYGALQLTEKARSILKGEAKLFLRQDVQLGLDKNKKKRHMITPADNELWEALKICRKQLADEQGVPPFHIFHDATLMEMMQYKPKTSADMMDISGVGEVKLNHYGKAFLQVLQQFST